jgi:hypothetical protein
MLELWQDESLKITRVLIKENSNNKSLKSLSIISATNSDAQHTLFFIIFRYLFGKCF